MHYNASFTVSDFLGGCDIPGEIAVIAEKSL